MRCLDRGALAVLSSLWGRPVTDLSILSEHWN
jgi:hypothetical protein